MPFDFGKLSVDKEAVKTAQKSSGGGFDFGGLQGRLEQIQKERADEERKRQEELVKKQMEAVSAFNQKREEISKGSIFSKGIDWVKENTGRGQTLPEISGASVPYTIQQQALEANRAYKDEVLGRVSQGAIDLGKAAVAGISKRAGQYGQSVKDKGIVKTEMDLITGSVKNIGELASGTAKLAAGLTPLTGFSGIRKLVGFVGGQQVEEFLDRSTPEYLKKVDAFIDDNGILNYHPKYANEIQRTGGEVTEIGSWFIPITRLGAAEKGASKLAMALKEIPVAKSILGVTPKIVKVGGKFSLEVAKDVVDVATLDAIRGKDWETIKDDMGLAAAGGGVLRGIIGGAKLTGSIAERMKIVKEDKLLKAIEDSIGKLDVSESDLVKTLVKSGRPIDDIATDIIERRAVVGNVAEEVAAKVDSPEIGTKELDAKENPEKIRSDWYRGVDDANTSSGDKFFSTDQKTARGFGKVEKIPESELPKNPLIIDDKDALGAKMKWMEKDPTKVSSFDQSAKEYAQSNGHDGIVYKYGQDGSEELHVFGDKKYTKSLVGDKTIPVTPIAKTTVAPKKTAPKPTDKKESVTAKKMNERIESDKQMSTEYDVIEINKKSDEAARLIEKDKSAAIKKAFSETGSNTEKVAILNELFESAVKNGDSEAMAMLFNRIKQLSTETGQALNMFKALTTINPHFHYMANVVSARLAKLKLTGSELKSAQLSAKRASITRDVKSVVRKAYKVEDAQALFNSIICK